MTMTGLALDLGTKTGWARISFLPDRSLTCIESGTWTLATDKELRSMKKAGQARCCDPRLLALSNHIDELGKLDWIIFEDVQFVKSRAQAQLWGSFRGLVMVRCKDTKVYSLPVCDLKTFATRNGGATKELMAIYLHLKHRDKYFNTQLAELGEKVAVEIATNRVLDDNEVDALHLLDYAIEKLALCKI